MAMLYWVQAKAVMAQVLLIPITVTEITLQHVSAVVQKSVATGGQ